MSDTNVSFSTRPWLYEYELGTPYSPASEQDIAAQDEALRQGKSYFVKGHHGYTKKFVVKAYNVG